MPVSCSRRAGPGEAIGREAQGHALRGALKWPEPARCRASRVGSQQGRPAAAGLSQLSLRMAGLGRALTPKSIARKFCENVFSRVLAGARGLPFPEFG
jgi:hypothetical protein